MSAAVLCGVHKLLIRVRCNIHVQCMIVGDTFVNINGQDLVSVSKVVITI